MADKFNSNDIMQFDEIWTKYSVTYQTDNPRSQKKYFKVDDIPGEKINLA